MSFATEDTLKVDIEEFEYDTVELCFAQTAG